MDIDNDEDEFELEDDYGEKAIMWYRIYLYLVNLIFAFVRFCEGVNHYASDDGLGGSDDGGEAFF